MEGQRNGRADVEDRLGGTERTGLGGEFFRREIYAGGPRAPEVRTYVCMYRCLHEEERSPVQTGESQVTPSVSLSAATSTPPLFCLAIFVLLGRATKSRRGLGINR